ncbi:hypothetical protein Mgra_00002564 [Meloidogyne graminicola]|uniref:Uncharacterized protein n=1 Tax=Meloidogyne graminicola TaxID=189291 RepID=A0A8S9ZX65_9BILA|nr:hypothetical protein Mgra_00002564 [Meloidogyne graminicola]
MPYTYLPFVVLFLPLFLGISSAIEKEDFGQKSGDDSNAFIYYECCGQILNDCCLKLQTWVIIVIAILLICTLLSIVLSFISYQLKFGDNFKRF